MKYQVKTGALGLSVVGVLTSLSSCSQKLPEKPNILVIITDQQSSESMSINLGSKYLNTPNMDYLARHGVSNTVIRFDGKSFLSILKGNNNPTRETVFVHYDPQWGNTSLNRNRFARTIDYKLYLGNILYKVTEDPLELSPVTTLTPEEKKIQADLQLLLNKAEKESPWIKERK